MRPFTSGLVGAALVCAVAATALAAEPAAAPDSPPRAAGSQFMHVAPGDRIGVAVENYREYSETLAVNVSGDVQLPGAAKLHVAGLADSTAIDAVQQTLWGELLSKPPMTVTVTHRVSVLGELKLPGIYWVDGTERVADLIARAGGTLPDARISAVRVTRADGSMKKNLKQDLQEGRTLSEIGLQPGDVVYVPPVNPLFDWRNWVAISSGLVSVFYIVDRLTQP